jgi:hypothetical protein
MKWGVSMLLLGASTPAPRDNYFTPRYPGSEMGITYHLAQGKTLQFLVIKHMRVFPINREVWVRINFGRNRFPKPQGSYHRDG